MPGYGDEITIKDSMNDSMWCYHFYINININIKIYNVYSLIDIMTLDNQSCKLKRFYNTDLLPLATDAKALQHQFASSLSGARQIWQLIEVAGSIEKLVHCIKVWMGKIFQNVNPVNKRFFMKSLESQLLPLLIHFSKTKIFPVSLQLQQSLKPVLITIVWDTLRVSFVVVFALNLTNPEASCI